MGRAQVSVPGLKIAAEDDLVVLTHESHAKVTIRFTKDGVTAQYGSEEPKTLFKKGGPPG